MVSGQQEKYIINPALANHTLVEDLEDYRIYCECHKKRLELTKGSYMYHFCLLLIISDPGQCPDLRDGRGGEG